MAKLNSILNERFKKEENSAKMTALAQKSSSGALTNFSGMFGINELSLSEKEELKNLLERYAEPENDLTSDLKSLSAITLEVKAINNQGALLHGERIKKAQSLLKSYREGAFTSWLLAVYGNRQTPYNFLQYFEFYETVSKEHHPLIDAMPRQAVYTLASREGSLDKKLEIIKEAAGKSKQELLSAIREQFPLSIQDKRSTDSFITLLNALQRARPLISNLNMTKEQREAVIILLNGLYTCLPKDKNGKS